MKMEELTECNICGSANIVSIDESNSICQCRSCGYVFDNPRPTSEETKRYYSQPEKYDSWLAEETARSSLWQRRLRTVKKERQSGTLLDVGTGTGQFLFFAQKDFDVTGTEISRTAARIAKERYDIDVAEGEIEDIDFGDSKFDVITCFHVLEHVPYPSKTVKQCRELLAEGGVLILAVPNDFCYARLIKHWFSIRKTDKHRGCEKYGLRRITLDDVQGEVHLSHFTVPVLKRLLSENGFMSIEDTLDPYYAAEGIKKALHGLFYRCCLLIRKAFGKNIYTTIWITARIV